MTVDGSSEDHPANAVTTDRVSTVLADYAATLAHDDLPTEVTEFVKLCVLDQLGVALFLSTLPLSDIVYAYAGAHSSGSCTTLGRARRVGPEQAAFINAITGHGFELDDYHLPSLNHPGTVAVPTALAVAEDCGASGVQVIAAVAAGYEVMGRIGRGLTPSYIWDRGFHPMGVVGPFGAAVVTARLRGATPDTMFHALGLAASHASGTVEYVSTFGETARLHAGIAAAGGLRSAFLAEAGFRGPGAPIEGKFGFVRAHADSWDLDIMLADLGTLYTLLFTAFKTRPYHGSLHCVIDVVLEALGGRRVVASDIDRIILRVNRHTVNILGARRVVEADISPETTMSAAQFTLHMPVAHAVLYGGTTEALLSFDGRDPAVVEVADRIELEVDEECDAEYHATDARGMRVKAKATIHFADGKCGASVNYAKGSPENPLTPREVRQKFEHLASKVLPDRQLESLADAVLALEDVRNIRALEPLLRVAGAS